MRQSSPLSLRDAVSKADEDPEPFIAGLNSSVALRDAVTASVLDGRGEEFHRRSVLVCTEDQLSAALALFELDGFARRIVLYPPDLSLDHISGVAASAEVDAIVTDKMIECADPIPTVRVTRCPKNIVSRHDKCSSTIHTEWVLLTSGTLGKPKLVVHDFASLTGAIGFGGRSGGRVVWSTFYDIRRYGGLQIFLRAVLTGASLVLSDASEPPADFLARAGKCGVTHISGTPSHWRRAMMTPASTRINPRCVRLSGEIVDEVILRRLKATYPQARIVHAFATTEAGVAFEVADGSAGVPAEVLDNTPGIEMKVVDGTLRIRSDRTADRYLGADVPVLKDADGFVDTGDILEMREGRHYFAGRRDGRINVGGFKVHPEEVEAVINRHPEVEMSLVRTRKNPIIGAVVVADVVLRSHSKPVDCDLSALRNDILHLCRAALSAHKVPAAINIVSSLAVAESGKMMRSHA